jgi:hypothetical protein
LAAAIGWNGPAVGLFAALLAWIFRPGAISIPEIQPSKKESTVKLTIVSEGGHVGDYLQLPIDASRLHSLAAGLMSGRALACREWTGQGALFSQSEFSRLRSILIARGLARWVSDRDPRGGCVLTAKGRATFAGLAQLPQARIISPQSNKYLARQKDTHSYTTDLKK